MAYLIVTGLTPDLNLNHDCVILYVRRSRDQVNRSKLCITIHVKVDCGCGILKRCQIWFGQKSAIDVVAESSAALIQYGEGDSSTERPFQEIVILPLHQVNEQPHVSSSSSGHAIRVDAHTELVPVKLCVNGRAFK